jgi:hypothetical protein
MELSLLLEMVEMLDNPTEVVIATAWDDIISNWAVIEDLLDRYSPRNHGVTSNEIESKGDKSDVYCEFSLKSLREKRKQSDDKRLIKYGIDKRQVIGNPRRFLYSKDDHVFTSFKTAIAYGRERLRVTKQLSEVNIATGRA